MHRPPTPHVLALSCALLACSETTNVYPTVQTASTQTASTGVQGGNDAGSGGGAGIGGGNSGGGDVGGSGTGGLPWCVSASDCPGLDDECQSRSCVAGMCTLAFTPLGHPIAAQVSGDCASVVCDGAGSTMSVYDAADLVPDGIACTADACTSQGPTFTEIGQAPICHVTCVPLDPVNGPARTTCSGVIVDDGGDGANFLGILWTDDKGTPQTGDDWSYKCGNIDALNSAPGCGCSQFDPAGICVPGMPCTIVRLVPAGTQYVGGVCE